ncbi:hypothetical protein [Caldivirga sp.]|uniref:hypothetical protein n=1 Tax=Caldivirga sp. TaxID=2080243 RepID=UPI00345BD2C0
MVKLLISSGAYLSIRDMDGRIPLDYAKEANHPEVIKLLKSTPTRVNTTHMDLT